MLQRWIVERRVWPDDEIAEGAAPFQRVGDLEAFQIFFQVVADAERNPPTSPALEVPTPAFVGKASSAKLFSRPSGVDLPELSQSTTVPTLKPAPEAPAEPSPELPPELPPEPETEFVAAPVVESEPEPATEEARFGEVIPGEAPAAFSGSVLDEPTMDMELGQDDFFSEEETAIADNAMFQLDGGSIDDDDDLEWDQTRRKGLVMWWLIFFGGLGGAGYFTLDFISQSEKEPVATVEPEATISPPVVADKEGDRADTAAPVAEPPAAPETGTETEPETKPEAVRSSKQDRPPQKSEPSASKKAAPVAKKVAPPARPNAEREVDRGWNQIDKKNWSKARDHFGKALSVAPGSVDGRYGMAYVNEHQGRVAEAVTQYCRLSKTTTGEIRNEVAGRLRTLGKECP
jgi:hypothetical protein